MIRTRVFGVILILLGGLLGGFLYTSQGEDARFPFRLGLDLAGGTHLVYQADIESVPQHEVDDAMSALREVVERRTNLFGVSEPVVQTETTFSGDRRLVVELPGVTDIEEAVAVIGETPILEFRIQEGADEAGTPVFSDTGLTGRFVERAQLDFGQSQSGGLSNEPIVVLHFNSEGAELFATITSENVGEVLGIFLDGAAISLPVIQQEIPGGVATISGAFTPEEARELVRDLNFGALPVPIALISSSSIGPTLGAETTAAGIMAGLIGFILVGIFMILWYRVPGFVAVLALLIYGAIVLSLFKVIPVTLTAAGIAAFILSVGMAVDANILIFERMKEELRAGRTLEDAIREGFRRAWPSIRDSNLSSLISAFVLFWFGTTLIKGFALVFGLGVLMSMLSAVLISRTLLLSLAFDWTRSRAKLFFGSGINIVK
ncbi:MAG: protein translocase subunit SecD [Patescibacteria group bacterium UBA2163]